MFVILFSVHLKGFLTESPFWYSQFTDPLCSKYWWTNLLYINNFYPTNGGEEASLNIQYGIFSKFLFAQHRTAFNPYFYCFSVYRLVVVLGK